MLKDGWENAIINYKSIDQRARKRPRQNCKRGF
jgi:hypothetical protein